MKERIAQEILEAAGKLTGATDVEIRIEEVQVTPTRDPKHGDYATNLALRLAGRLRRKPREIAEELAGLLREGSRPWSAVEVAGPGFLNFRLGAEAWQEVVRRVLAEGDGYGRAPAGSRERVQIEYVSANPTGPMNVVSARAGAVGDSLARILAAAGCRVETEFYVNDAGNQIRLYGLSLRHHLGRLLGREIPLPEEGYQGDYLREIAEKVREAGGAGLLDAEGGDPDGSELGRLGARATVAWQQEDLAHYGVSFDRWFHEADLRASGELEATLEELRARGVTYESEGAVWLRTSDFGDERDRVLVKSDGAPAYLLGDIAYHRNKLARGYDRLIDIWGPDHHGHVIRMKAAMQALGVEPERLEILIVQQVNLLADGEKVKMSKRAGEFITLRELVDDVGHDPARFFFVMRKADSHLDFDMDLARRQSKENPVYYVEYVHARCHSLVEQAARAELPVPSGVEGPLHRLVEDAEVELAKQLSLFPATVAAAAESREVQRIPYYLQELASRFHAYYFEHRFIGDDAELSAARLMLARAVAQVIRSGLDLLGIEAPESM